MSFTSGGLFFNESIQVAELYNSTNDIVHKLNDLAQYSRPTQIAKSAIFTAVEACKEIEKHFSPDKDFSYREWLEEYPVENTGFFNHMTTS